MCSAVPEVLADPVGGGSDISAGECVILLHGLGRTASSFRPMASALGAAGYSVVNPDYPSREHRVEALAESVIPQSLAQCERLNTDIVHFVTHSLGGILVRAYLGQNRPQNLGRVVMLSPPNQGSEAADRLVDWPPFQWINGPAGQQLITGEGGLHHQLGPVDYPVGIITGNQISLMDAWMADSFEGPHDGKVSVERAAVDGMQDFLVLPYSHPFILQQKGVMAETICFLRDGKFCRASGSGNELLNGQ